jgi:hypothetical protein
MISEKISKFIGTSWHGSNAFEVMVCDIPSLPTDVVVRRHDWRPCDRLLGVRGVEGVYVVSPELALEQICAESGPVVTALLTDELCGTYRMVPDDSVTMKIGRAPRMCARGFERHVAALGETAAAGLREAASLAVDGCASPVEAKTATLLSMSRAAGGCGLPRPRMHAPVVVRSDVAASTGMSVVRAGMLWPASMVALEFVAEGRAPRSPFEPSRVSAASRVLCATGYDVAQPRLSVLFEAQGFASVAEELAYLIDPAAGSLWSEGAESFGTMHARLVSMGDPALEGCPAQGDPDGTVHAKGPCGRTN